VSRSWPKAGENVWDSFSPAVLLGLDIGTLNLTLLETRSSRSS